MERAKVHPASAVDGDSRKVRADLRPLKACSVPSRWKEIFDNCQQKD